MEFVDTRHIEFASDARLIQGAPVEAAVAGLVRDLLLAFGEDPEREGLRRTPERVARSVQELLAGYQTDPAALINDAIFASDYQGTVLVRDIQFYSLCEHHLLPFFGRAHVAYVPDARVLGLSKIPRVVEMFARRLQMQEQLTQQIGEFLQKTLEPRGVAVVLEGAHFCAMMRGVRQSDARMVTKTMLGAYATDATLRSELMAQLGVTNHATL
jgi:GTP cyclohydrolase I